MRAEIVAVGTELLLGQIANTNARWMSEQLAAVGVDVLHHQTVGDNVDRVAQALSLAASRADVVLVTGGLGPTQDDLTREAIALVAGVPLVRRPELEVMLREKFRGFSGRSMPENNLQQADVPEGARAVMPQRGTAPGLVVDLPGEVRLYAMAGVPLEMVEIMEGTVLPELATRTGAAIVSRVLRVTGMGESAVAEALADLFDASTNPTVAFLATGGEVKVRLTAKAATHEEAERRIAPLADEVAARLGDVVFSTRDESLEGTVLRLLLEKGLTICTRGVVDGRERERAFDRRAERLRGRRRRDRRVLGRGKAGRARGFAGDARGRRRRERGVRARDGRRRPPSARRGRVARADGGGGAGAPRRRGARARSGSRSRRRA